MIFTVDGVRLVLDITMRPDGRYFGQVTVTETGARHAFGGVLELLAILERQLAPDQPGIFREEAE